jgi:hypothetical protein
MALDDQRRWVRLPVRRSQLWFLDGNGPARQIAEEISFNQPKKKYRVTGDEYESTTHDSFEDAAAAAEASLS